MELEPDQQQVPSRMRNRGKNSFRRRRGGGRVSTIVVLGLLMVVVLVGIAVRFTPIPAKLKQRIHALSEQQPRSVASVSAAERESIRKEIESRLRVESEKKLAQEVARMRAELAAETSVPGAEIEGTKLVLPTNHEPGIVTDVRQLRSGIPFESEVKTSLGGLASRERIAKDSYTARYELSLRFPTASRSLEELETVSPGLGKMLPGIPAMLENATVSPRFFSLYKNKESRIRRNANDLNELLSKHNLYDCETMLHLEAPSGRKVFFVQSEMDVVADGSDGDRLAEMPEAIVNSTHYQPFTSYGWVKKTKTPNPMIAGLERRIGNAKRELAEAETTADRKAWLRKRMTELERAVSDLKYRSYLIAEYDPFIVIATDIVTAASDPFAPRVGDYAAVIHDGKIYPSIVGDAGPTFKAGEASLRIAKQLNPRSSPYSRPVSDLTVSYLVFPNSRDATKGPPDLAHWRQRCAELIGEIGGLGEGHALYEWEDLLAPPPAPEPPPTTESSDDEGTEVDPATAPPEPAVVDSPDPAPAEE